MAEVRMDESNSRDEVRRVKCPRCHAQPGYPCSTDYGTRARNHSIRVKAWKRAKRKGEITVVCSLCEGEGHVLKGASIYSLGRPEIVECPNCAGTGHG